MERKVAILIRLTEDHHILTEKRIFKEKKDMVHHDNKCWTVVREYKNRDTTMLDLMRPTGERYPPDGKRFKHEIATIESLDADVITHSSQPIEEYINEHRHDDLRFDKVKYMPVLNEIIGNYKPIDKSQKDIETIKSFCETLIKSNTNKMEWSSSFCTALYAVLGRINSLGK